MSSLGEVLPSLKENAIEVWVTDIGCPHEGVNTLLDKVEQASDMALPDCPRADLMSNFLFIFTSGTTGSTLILTTTKKSKLKVFVDFFVVVVEQIEGYRERLCQRAVGWIRSSAETIDSLPQDQPDHSSMLF